MSLYLLDADCAIYVMTRQKPALRNRLAQCDPDKVVISAITFAEVAVGSFAGKEPALELLERFTRTVRLLPFDEAAARKYAELPFKRSRFDRLLAAHALSIGATVVTNNESDFADVPGLKVENWTLE
ncbi:MAG: type II toxin-antitoxin system VapC family toxin [Porphyrobacter sp.]|nr:type II toxin-antitoxin system VapC family toxin [Porphyrobacter sp.]